MKTYNLVKDLFYLPFLALCAGVLSATALPAYAEGEEPLTQEEQLNAMLDPLGYVSIHHVEWKDFGWWTTWLDRNSPGYSAYITASAIPGARCALVYKLQGNEWWHRMLFFYDWNESDFWLAEESGTFNESTPATTYTLSTGAEHSGNWFDQSLYYVTICDLPDLVNHQMISGMFWQLDGVMDMYVIAPNGRIVYGIKPSVKSATLALGESMPFSAVVYDKITGTEYPDIPVTYSTDPFLSYANGTLRARAVGKVDSDTATGTITASATTDDGAVEASVKVTIPFPYMQNYTEFATFDINQTSANWWISVNWQIYGAMGVALNHDNVIVKVEYSNYTEGEIGTGDTFVLNDDWFQTRGWFGVPAGSGYTLWLALADAVPSVNAMVGNIATGLTMDKITVYTWFQGTVLLFQ